MANRQGRNLRRRSSADAAASADADATVQTAATAEEVRRRWEQEDFSVVASQQTGADRGWTMRDSDLVDMGWPQRNPAEVRAASGRGFTSLVTGKRRNKRSTEPLDLDPDLLYESMVRVVEMPGILNITLWDVRTGLELGGSAADAAQAARWQLIARKFAQALPQADLPEPGDVHLISMDDARLAVLILGDRVGVCVTADLEQTQLGTLLSSTVPQIQNEVQGLLPEAVR